MTPSGKLNIGLIDEFVEFLKKKKNIKKNVLTPNPKFSSFK